MESVMANPYSNPYAFAEIFKQSFDMNQLFATQRRNIEALSAANQAIVEGAQAVSRRQAEAVRENVEKVLSASREMFNGGSPEAGLTRQAELTKTVFENALNNVREVTEMLTKSSFEAFDVLTERANKSIEELSKSAPSKKKAA
jgi:phasin family protein